MRVKLFNITIVFFLIIVITGCVGTNTNINKSKATSNIVGKWDFVHWEDSSTGEKLPTDSHELESFKTLPFMMLNKDNTGFIFCPSASMNIETRTITSKSHSKISYIDSGTNLSINIYDDESAKMTIPYELHGNTLVLKDYMGMGVDFTLIREKD